jgi:hypothetical protein
MARVAHRARLGFLLLVLILGAGAATGQTIDWLATQNGLAVARDPGSARLAAMGGLEVSIADENGELNLLDYGGNVCGFLTDSDHRRWDAWRETHRSVRDTRDAAGARTRVRSQISETGGRMAWRNGTSRVLGGDVVFDELTNSIEQGTRTKVSGPMWGVFGAQKVSIFTVGGAVRTLGDNQDVRSESVFAIRHEGSGLRGMGALAIDLGKLQFGAQAELQKNTINGLSRDESRFHEDKLTWKRPVEIYDLTAFWKPTEMVSGAVRARIVRLDGREEVKISWSDRMPDNPSQSNFLSRTGTFKEKRDGTEFGTRWEARPLDGVLVGVRLDHAKLDETVIEGKNYKGSRRASDTSDKATVGGGGASYEFPSGRLRVGAEGWFSTLESKVREVEAMVTTKARQVEFRAGGEYYLRDWLILRAGFQRISYDSNTDQPRSLQLGNGYTAGVGYVSRGGLYQIDAGIRVMNLDPDYSGFPNAEDGRTSIMLGARFLL